MDKSRKRNWLVSRPLDSDPFLRAWSPWRNGMAKTVEEMVHELSFSGWDISRIMFVGDTLICTIEGDPLMIVRPEDKVRD